MSWPLAEKPVCRAREGRIPLVIGHRERDLGELTVRRAPPAGGRRMVGPFVSSSRDRIATGRRDRAAMRIPRVPGDDEPIPLPDETRS